jgi:hypothetical protein
MPTVSGGKTTILHQKVSTPDATPVVLTWPKLEFATQNIVHVDAVLIAVSDDKTKGASYRLRATFRRNAGLAQVGATTVEACEDDGAWDAQLGISGGEIAVTVVGDAAQGVSWFVDAQAWGAKSA